MGKKPVSPWREVDREREEKRKSMELFGRREKKKKKSHSLCPGKRGAPKGETLVRKKKALLFKKKKGQSLLPRCSKKAILPMANNSWKTVSKKKTGPDFLRGEGDFPMSPISQKKGYRSMVTNENMTSTGEKERRESCERLCTQYKFRKENFRGFCQKGRCTSFRPRKGKKKTSTAFHLLIPGKKIEV